MTLLGLPVWAYLAGLAGLGVTLFALHLLRIRLRRQTVDSLLFFQQLGAVHKPRVLPGRPARWLSFLLGLALLALAWTAFGQPRGADDGPSRVLVVDTSAATAGPTEAAAGSIGDALATRAVDIATDDGLGPRGRVVAFGAAVRAVWQAGEPTDRIVERLAVTPEAGGTDSVWNALSDAAQGLRPGDELVVLGGPALLPDEIGGIPVRRAEAPAGAAAPAIAAVRVTRTSPRAIDVEATTGSGPGVVRIRRGAETLAETPITTSSGGRTSRVLLGPLPDDAGTLVVEVEAETGARASVEVGLPEQRTLLVHVAPGLPDAVTLAIDADPRATATDVAGADVAIAPSDTALPDGLPALIVARGAGDALRTPRLLPTCPLPLSLRDRSRSASALASSDGEVWVEDAATGAALVVRRGNRVRAVSWLLEDPAHRDVPALVLGAIRAVVPDAPARVGPTSGPAPAGGTEPPELDVRSGAWPWIPFLLALALLALAADVWLHHRGRVA